ncbi:MAG TPA: hypothetical protein DCR63_00205 [Microbacterium sp.]|nr:hypothetical protein [Microbacterium sp.]
MRRFRSASPVQRGAVALIIASGLALAGCTAAPAPTTTSSGDPSPETTTPGTTPAVEASAPVQTSADISIPIRCEDIYSPSMLSQLQSENPPLNDPGVTMDSTEVVEALEILAAGAQTLRCSWGLPSSYGLATNVTIVEPDQALAVLAALPDRGLVCSDLAGGTLCRVQNDDGENAFGESHYLRGNGWVSTRWINFGPRGYTEDVISSLWG